jgi:hypothetical protein
MAHGVWQRNMQKHASNVIERILAHSSKHIAGMASALGFSMANLYWP